MNFKEVEKLIDIFSKNSISSISIREGEFEIHLEKNTPAAQVHQASSIASVPAPVSDVALESPDTSTTSLTNNESGDFIESPMVGTFYRCPAPNAAPYINVGDKIKKGQIIGIVEAMKIMNEIEAEFDCKVVEIIANDAQPVEYGSKLIKIEKI